MQPLYSFLDIRAAAECLLSARFGHRGDPRSPHVHGNSQASVGDRNVVKVVLFGAGSGFADLLSMLPDHVQVVAVCDNDSSKHGQTVMGHVVSGRDALPTTEFDYIVITTRSGSAIRSQLVGQGIPREKILLFYPGFDEQLRQMANADVAVLNQQLGLGLHPLSLCTMQIWPDPHPELPSGQDDFCRMMSIRLAADRVNQQAIAGAIAELGVYRGELAAVLNQLFPNRRLYLFDTFEGFSQNDLAGGEERQHSKSSVGDFKDTSVDTVLARMAHPGNIVLRKGYFPQTAEGLEETFAFVSLDVDLYKPILAGLNYFYPRLIDGGYLFVHDYNNRRFGGVRTAVDQFSKAHGVSFVQLPDFAGSIVITK
jgi:O-methyltransferase